MLEKSGARVGLLPVIVRTLASSGLGGDGRTVTDASGVFSFPQLSDGEYLVRTEATDLYQSTSVLVRTGSDSTVIVVERKPADSIDIRGVVASASGGTLDGVRVDVVGEQAPGTVSDTTGAYILRVLASDRLRTAALRFRRDGYREKRVPLGQAVRLSELEWIADVSLDALRRLVPVAGVVTGDDGTSVERATVQLDSVEGAQSYRALTDAAGRFRLDRVEEGRDYTLWVRPRATYKDGLLNDLVVGQQGRTLAIVLKSLGVASLEGRMVDPDGAPVAGFTLWLTAAYGGAARAIAVTGDAQGRFTVQNLPEGPVALSTRSAPRISISGVQLTASAARNVTLPIDTGSHRIDGVVLSTDGTPVAGAALSLQWSSATADLVSRSSRETITDQDGRFAFGELGLGGHALTVRAPGFIGTQLQQPAGAGSTPVEIRLRRSQ